MKNSDSIENAPAVPVRVAADERAAFLLAATACGHSIDSEEVTLRRDPTKPGNALHQLTERLSAAHSAALAVAPVQAQEPVALPTPAAYRYPCAGENNGFNYIPSIVGEEARFVSLWEPMFTQAQVELLMHQRAPVQPVAVAVPDVWISELVGGIADELSYGHGYRQGFNDCRAKVLAMNPAAPAVQGDAKDAERLEFIESGTFDVRCYNDHDDDVYWNVIEHHMAAPIEREIGWGNTARQAIDAAIAAKAAAS